MPLVLTCVRFEMPFRSASLNSETFKEFVFSEVSSSPVADVSNLVSRFFPEQAQTAVTAEQRWFYSTHLEI